MVTRREVSKKLAEEYQRSGKKRKGQLLTQLVEMAGYHRKYAAWLLGNWGRKVVVWQGSQRVTYVGVRPRRGQRRRIRPRRYGPAVLETLRKVWHVLDCCCSKRLVDNLAETLRVLERIGVLALTAADRALVLGISARTVDRLLKNDRRRLWGRIRGGTKPGTLLKSQIPVRMFSQWDGAKPGFVEIDLVEHNGGSCHGIYAVTLNVTDIATGWTEPIAVANKSQHRVLAGLVQVQRRFPIGLRGIDCDGGGEFINHHLVRFCEQRRITFTRCRPYRKNDQCYIEQKNWSTVRKIVGYERYETRREVALLNRIYQQLRCYQNFFLPQMKLVRKVRHGSRVTRYYDTARTPYQRLLAHPQVPADIKRRLHAEYETLNPLLLRETILRLRQELFTLYVSRKRRPVQPHPAFVKILT